MNRRIRRTVVALPCALSAALLLASAAGAATIEVDATGDDLLGNEAGCSLREAIFVAGDDQDSLDGSCLGEGAYGNDTITFDPAITGAIELEVTHLTIDGFGEFSIEGPGSDILSVVGPGADRVFHVAPGNVASISGLSITGGQHPTNGAGIYNQGTLTLDGVDVHDNGVDSFDDGEGGTAFAQAQGGGIDNTGSLTVERSTVADNAVSAITVDGGAGFNIATADGGGIASSTGSLTVSDSTISGNSIAADAGGADPSSVARGGGILVSHASAQTISGSTIADNLPVTSTPTNASFGGGIFSVAVAPNLISSTITGNQALNGANMATNGTSMSIENSIVAEPFNGVGGNCTPAPETTADHSLVGDSSCNLTGDDNIIDPEPNLDPLGDFGGPTETRPPSVFDLTPAAGPSPAIDAGIGTGSPTDQRGYARTWDFDIMDVTDGTDIGAAEMQGPTITAITPASPNTDAFPEISGIVEATSLVRIFPNATCQGSPANQAFTGVFASPGITVGPLSPNTSTTFSANSTVGSLNSVCSPTTTTYVVPPSTPSLSSTNPASPANDNTLFVKGGADTGTTVTLYTAADCTGAPAGSGSAAQLADPGIGVTVADNSTTTFYAQATGANGTSPCSTGLGYTEVTPPPVIPGDPPAGPTGQRAAALKKCKKKKGKARKKCIAKAKKLPV